MNESDYVEELIFKGRIDYIKNKSKEPNVCVLRPEQYYKLDFIKSKPDSITYMGMKLICSNYIIENTMLFYCEDELFQQQYKNV